MKIIFMGTPEFAVPTLQKLLDDKDFEVVAIYTREPQIAGRGHKLTNSPIHNLALQNNIKVLTPKTLRNKEIQEEFARINADAAVVVAYGLILPQEILQATKFGCINLHPSLLPRHRGPSPIQYTFFAQDPQTGVTIIKMDAGIDSGDIILQQKFMLEQKDDYCNIAPKLADIGANMILESLKNLRDNKATFTKQDEKLATFSKKLIKEQSEINWQNSAEEILAQIRGLSGSLTAFFKFNDEIIKVYKAKIIDAKSQNNKVAVEIDKAKKQIVANCKIGKIELLELQKQGRNKVSAQDFINSFLG